MTMPPSHSVPPRSVSPMPAARPLPPLPPLPSPNGPAWLRSPVGLGRAAVALLALVIAADLFAVWADWTMYDVSGALAGGDFGDGVQDRAADADTLVTTSGYAQSATMVGSVVVFLLWFLRVRTNAEVFSPHGHSKSRAWAGWGWFVPVVSLWFPRRVTLDIWDASAPAGSRSGHALVNVWWTFWVLTMLTDRVSSRSYTKAGTAGEIHDAAAQVLFCDVVDIVAAALAILVVLRLTRMQHLKALQGPAAHAG
ncbi:DUF4328 domain-containing protein [Streptomyces sp. NPDC048512]|uniref:DUF4328 domain-containing protein n=1 Tax=Streptomyces sp. NPDC048512 TaxID=3365563 RepID=UPI00371107CB